MGKPPAPDTSQAQPAWASAFEVLARGVDTVLAVDEDGHTHAMRGALGGIGLDALRESALWSHAASEADALRAAIHHAFSPGLGQVTQAAIRSGTQATWYRFHAIPCQDMAIVVATNIDNERREGERLAQSERMMLDAQGMAHLGTWYWEITEPHARWSPELYAIYGLPADIHVPTYEDYLTRVHPDDRERVKTATEAVFNDHSTYSHDERIMHTDGRWRHLHTWARPILDDAGNLKALQGVCLDITARKEAEAALAQSEVRSRHILDHAGMGIASILADGTIEAANPAFDELTGTGATVQDRFPHITAALAEVPEENSRDYTGTPATHPDRHVRLLLTKDVDANIRVCIARDVTAEVEAQEAARRIQELEVQQTQQRRMMGVASHEIKNPLTPMLMQLYLLTKGTLGPLTERQERSIQTLYRQAQRLSHVVEDTLTMTRAQDAPPQPATEVDLAELVAEAARLQSATATEFGVLLNIDVPDAAPATVHAGRISQVVDNLVLNALRFTPSGKNVNVALQDGGDHWLLSVTDEGVGISEELQQRAFEPYVRGNTEAPHPMHSSGLGLFIVKAFAEADGGSVSLQSTEGEGTTVEVRLPK